MEIDHNYDRDADYSLAAFLNALSGARQFVAGMAPNEADPTEVRFLKEVLRWSAAVAGSATAVAGAAAVALVVLEPGQSVPDATPS